MAESNEQKFVQMTPEGNEHLGTIEIAPEVITVIAGIATNEIEGIAGTRGNFATEVVERLGKKMHGKGIKTEITKDGLFIDVYCLIKYGASVPTVAMEVQTHIRQAIETMTNLVPTEVNVHITGVQFDTTE